MSKAVAPKKGKQSKKEAAAVDYEESKVEVALPTMSKYTFFSRHAWTNFHIDLDEEAKAVPAQMLSPDFSNTAKPKAARSAYMFFSGPTIKRLMEEEGMKMTECAKKAGLLWADMSDKEKAPYVEQHDKDVLR